MDKWDMWFSSVTSKVIFHNQYDIWFEHLIELDTIGM
ncbi:hypothetical protein EVB55_120 [Rhizobium phage RHph_Y68]|uniref:Uncharacterized protein n=1 Tax=Rhizobium phage RHph_Y68 TaxID=2509787 RepID=A0A7S5URP2_9CAUD|nr:hypothetical protein PP934_gp120 [Rhizobium phage RHph_Y68]QIG68055.1 hypothetical protein EVB55_120 [Rhizobium phage RHph_Y68]